MREIIASMFRTSKSLKKDWCLERHSESVCIYLNLNATLKFKMHRTNAVKVTVARLKPPPAKRKLILYLYGAILVSTLSSIIPPANSEAVNESPLTDYDGASFYKAPVGSRIRMACNGSHWATDESVSLVLWFKGPVEGHSVPIYTVDARQHSLGSGVARHLIADQYKGRARFTATSGQPDSLPYLDLGPLEADDQGEYRCRIDYRTKPRENFLVILFVLVPPRSVDITDSTGRSLEQIYGPLSEDSDLTLLCLSKGGRPAPALRWKRANKLIDDSYLTLNDFVALKRASNLLQAPSTLDLTPNNGSLAPEEASLVNGNWLDWGRWPEFDYFSGRFNASLPAPHNNEASTIQRKQPAGNGHQEQELVNQPQHRQLLSWPVEESLTTSVNVLRLADLNVRNLASSYEDAAKLECEASNLFYDLHTLIKLFAPASLAGQGSAQQVATKQHNDQQQSLAVASQLELAIDQALDRALTSSSLGPSLHHPDQPKTASSVLQIGLLRQTQVSKALMSKATLQDVSLTSMSSNPAGSDKQQPGAALASTVALFQQILQRPHQLSASMNITVPSIATQAFQANHRQDQLNLVRTRLITLDIYMRPLSVSISQLPAQSQRTGSSLSAGQLAEFSCSSSGSRPPAKLTWFKGRERLDVRMNVERQFQDSSSGNSSCSKLTVRLERSDHGQLLTCRAENEHLQQLLLQNHLPAHQSMLEDIRTLSVQYPPQLKLELGNRALSTQVREGADIFFVCHIDANPQVREITWLHNQQPVNTTVGKLDGRQGAVIVSNNSLVLQKVRLNQRGRYTCASSNSEGYAESGHLELRVLHAPRCLLNLAQSNSTDEESQPLLLGTRQVAIRAHTQLECLVEADPVEVEISWYLGGAQTGSRRLISSSQVVSPPTTATFTTMRYSKLNYQVQNPLDYGQLYCVAKNQLGEQKRACYWNIEAPDPARAPPSCALFNVTDSSVTAACSMLSLTGSSNPVTASDSENNRQLNVELYRGAESGGLSLEANLSTVVHLEEPYFEVNSLRPGTQYTILIRSVYGQPPAELSFLTHPSTSGSRLDSHLAPSSETSASLSALISTRSATTLTDSADWTPSEHRSGSFTGRYSTTRVTEPEFLQSRLASLWSWLSGSIMRVFGLEKRLSSDSVSSGPSGDSTPAIVGGGGANRLRTPKLAPSLSSINKPWELSRWHTSGTGESLGWRQLITSTSLVGFLLLIGLLAILLLAHKYSSSSVACIWWQWRRDRSTESATSSSDHNYHQHSNTDKTLELANVASIHNKQTNLSSLPPTSLDSVESIEERHMKQVKRPSVISPTTIAPSYRASTLDRAAKTNSSNLIKSRSSFSFEVSTPMGVVDPAGSYMLANNHLNSGGQIFLSSSNGKYWHQKQKQRQLGEAHGTELRQLEAPLLDEQLLTTQEPHQPHEYDMLTMQLCQQMLHSQPNQSANLMSLIKSNQPLILTGSGSPIQQTSVVGDDPNRCCQVSCIMHEQPPINDAQFVPVSSNSSYLEPQYQLDQWTTTTAGQPIFLKRSESPNFMDQQMDFMELLPRHSGGGGSGSPPSQQHQLQQHQCMDINLNFVNIVDGTQSVAPIGSCKELGPADSTLGKVRDLPKQSMLTQCHRHPVTYLSTHKGSLECPSLTSSASPSSSTFKDQSPLSSTTTGQSTVTTSTNYSTLELFPFSVGSGSNCLALLKQQQQQ